jgi:hypothetical protein
VANRNQGLPLDRLFTDDVIQLLGGLLSNAVLLIDRVQLKFAIDCN